MHKSTYFIRLVLLISLIVTSIFSFIQIDQNLAKILIQDKLLHAAVFSLITFLAYASKFDINRITIFIGLILYGLLIEITQNYLSYRSFELYDLLSDIVGVAIGYSAWKFLKKLHPDYWFILFSP